MPRRRHDPDSLVTNVGRRVGEIRADRALTQAQLAEKMGCSTRYIAQIEAGQNLTIETLAQLATLLDVEVTVFFEKPTNSTKRKRGRPKKTTKSAPVDEVPRQTKRKVAPTRN